MELQYIIRKIIKSEQFINKSIAYENFLATEESRLDALKTVLKKIQATTTRLLPVLNRLNW